MPAADTNSSRRKAAELDARDPLAPRRQLFEQPEAAGGQPAVYLCGNSLGLLPRAARTEVNRLLDDWSRLAVRGHDEGTPPWIPYHRELTGPLARLVGAHPDEVVAMNSLTVNLHLLMVSFYRPTSTRNRIVSLARSFSSDRHAIDSQIRFHGHDPNTCSIELAPRPGERTLRMEDIEATLRQEGERVALVLLEGVHYQTGQLFDLQRIARIGREIGAVVGFDLAHAAGNVPLALHDWDVDFAVWCSYKYLNGGPGAPGGCFVHQRHVRDFAGPRFAGWWGSQPGTRFAMDDTFAPQPSADGWQLSNPPVVAMAALKASLELFDQVGMVELRAKSEKLTGYLHELLRAGPTPCTVITPGSPDERGCQLSIQVPGNAAEVVNALGDAGVVCDARPPDIVRVAPVPLYNSFADVVAFADSLSGVLESA